MRLLALDIATTTGWAFWRPGLPAPISGIKKFAKDPGAKYLGFRDFLIERLDALHPDRIAIEAPFISKERNGDASVEILYGLRAHAIEICERRGRSWVSVPPDRWRSAIIGCTKAPRETPKNQRREWLKQRSIDECRRRGWLAGNDDEAEALCLLAYERRRIFPEYGVESALFGFEAAP